MCRVTQNLYMIVEMIDEYVRRACLAASTPVQPGHVDSFGGQRWRIVQREDLSTSDWSTSSTC